MQDLLQVQSEPLILPGAYSSLFSSQLPHNVGETKVFSVEAAADTAKSCWNFVSTHFIATIQTTLLLLC